MVMVDESHNSFLEDKLSDFSFVNSCRSDPIFFIENVLNYKLDWFHKEWLDASVSHRYLAIECPVGHSKTTVITKGYTLWRSWRQPNFQTVITSNSLDQSKGFLSGPEGIQKEVEENIFLQSLVPSSVSSEWNKKEVKFSNGSHIKVKPFTDSARGVHPDLIVYDDILQVSKGSEKSSEDISEIFWSVFFPRGQTRRCQHILVGTPRSEGDLFDELELKSKNSDQWHHFHYQCVETNPLGTWVKPLWSNRFTLDELHQIKDNMSPIRFAREYMCNPQSVGNCIFNREKLISRLDPELSFSSYLESDNLVEQGLDLAFSKNPKSDWTVLTTVESFDSPYSFMRDGEVITVNNPIIVRDMSRTKGVDTTFIQTKYDTYGCSLLHVDSSSGGGYVESELRELGLNIDGQNFAHANRNSLLLNLLKLIDQGRIIFPFKEGSSAEFLVKQLMRELTGFIIEKTNSGLESFQSTTKHDDCVMSLALAVVSLGRQVYSSSNVPILTLSNEDLRPKSVLNNPNQSFTAPSTRKSNTTLVPPKRINIKLH